MQGKKIFFGLFVLICFFNHFLVAQDSTTKMPIDTTSSDGLFQAARRAAFDNKNYPLAKNYCKRALEKSPNYADIRIFLGRMYTWTDQYDSAKTCFETVLAREPDYEDASLAYADLQYWNNYNKETIAICDAGLKAHPDSKELLIRKAKALTALKEYAAATAITNLLLQKDKTNTDARSLATRIKDVSVKHKIGISYDYNYFDQQYDDPWHLLSIDYSRSTGIGSIIGRINHANRFASSGTQFEIDAYPHINKTFYSYVNLGFGDNTGLFPKFRAGFSLYANLPKSFEAEIGFRYLKFSGPATWIYTASAGKYVGNWLLGARVYITPSDFIQRVSVTYNLTARYYLGGADDFIGGVFGYGISPDEKANLIQINTPLLSSYKLGASYRKRVNVRNNFTAELIWYNQEYLPGTKGNQYLISAGWQFRF